MEALGSAFTPERRHYESTISYLKPIERYLLWRVHSLLSISRHQSPTHPSSSDQRDSNNETKDFVATNNLFVAATATMRKESRHIRLIAFAVFLCLVYSDGFQVSTQPTANVVFKAESTLLKEEQKQTIPRKAEPSSPETDEIASLPPVIQSIADERMEYQMNLGKAMDTLRKDYQDILTKRPGMCSDSFIFQLCKHLESHMFHVFVKFYRFVCQTSASMIKISCWLILLVFR